MRTSRPWKKKPELYPGWKMTPAQHRMYWNLLQRAYKQSPDREGAGQTFDEFRAVIHVRAFGTNISAKDIDRMKGFDEFKAQCLAIIQPANLGAQMAIENMEKTRLIHRICNDFPASYILCLINSPRFARCRQNEARAGLEDLERWTEKDLTDLRTTLCARNPSDTSDQADPSEVAQTADENLTPF
jgi:hypothetical protein